MTTLTAWTDTVQALESSLGDMTPEALDTLTADIRRLIETMKDRTTS